VIVGVEAVTVTVKEQAAVSPDGALTVAVTVVVPIGKVEPDGGVDVTGAPAQAPPVTGTG